MDRRPPSQAEAMVNQIACVLAFASVLALQAGRDDRVQGASPPVLGACNTVPNYTTSKLPGMPGAGPALRRWGSFPLTYSVDTSGMPAAVRKLYDEAGVVARDLWSVATAARIGQLRQVASGGQISVRFVPLDLIPSPGFTTIAGSGNVITSASIQMGRLPDDVSLIERGLQRRVTLQTANTLAHEIGHALGIQLHSPDESDLMNENGNFLPGRDDARDPRSFITAADRNTMLHAYCR